MHVELGYALAPPASPGIGRASLDRLDVHVADAHGRIAEGVAVGETGYCALDLYNRVDLGAIEEVVDGLPEYDSVLVVGIGGSALGARTAASALAPTADFYVLDTLDPDYLEPLLERIDMDRTVCHVVSKSGSTVETRAVFDRVTTAMADAGVDWTDRTIATTGADGPLGRRIEAADATRLDPPAGVPGRYSVLSTMALPSLAAVGIDIEGLLVGAERAHRSLSPSLYETPAYAFGAAMAALANRGATQNAFVTYGEAISDLGDWFAQLWAESLGKDALGQTPIPGRGVADHHSQLQRWRAGRRDLVVTTVATDPTEQAATEIEGAGMVDLGELQALERRAMTASLGAAGVPAVEVHLGELDPASLGATFVSLEAATMLVAELWGIDAFDQPAVDWAKSAVRGELGLEMVDERPSLDSDDRLRVELERRG